MATSKKTQNMKIDEPALIDRFLRLRQRMELVGGSFVVVRTRKGKKLFQTVGRVNGLENTLFHTLDELEKVLPLVEELPDYVEQYVEEHFNEKTLGEMGS